MTQQRYTGVDIQELVLNLEDTSSFKSNMLDFVNDPPSYEYPEHDMVIPANSECGTLEYAHSVNFPEFENLVKCNISDVDNNDTQSYVSSGLTGRQLVIEFPRVDVEGRLQSLQILSELFKCSECPTSYMQFWFFDIITECLMYAQDCPELGPASLSVIIQFLVMFLRDLRIRQLDLCGMMTHLKLRIESYQRKLLFNVNVNEGELLNEDEHRLNSSELTDSDENSEIEEEGTSIDLTKNDMEEIFFVLDYIYTSFGNTFIYRTLQLSLLEPHVVEEQDLPYRIEFPKDYLPSNLENPTPAPKAKSKKGKEQPKKDKKKSVKEDAPKEPEEEVLDVAQLEAIRQEQLKKYILPLKMAVEKQFFTDLFKKAAEQDAANKKSGKQKK